MIRKASKPQIRGAPVGHLGANLRDIGIDLSQYDLSSVSDCFKLIGEVVRACLEGRISPRQAGAANNSLRILLSFHEDVAHAVENKKQLDSILAILPADLKAKLEEEGKNDEQHLPTS